MQRYLPFASLVVLLLFVSAFIVVSGCAPKSAGNGGTGLEVIEIKEYQGEDLSSINDFRENSIAGPQYVDKEKYRLEITGLVNSPLSLTYDEVISQHPTGQKLVTLNCVEGWSVKILWDGVFIKDLLQPAGIKPEAKGVVFYAADGYTTMHPLDFLIGNNILLAYKMNGVTLPPERGFPFHLVAESKWGYKWIKWVTKIELIDNTDYRGYWESRGYSNDGNLNEEFFDFGNP